jgi:hypothetical protein
MGVVELAVSEIVGLFGVVMSLFLQPIIEVDISIAQSRAFDFFMVDSGEVC